MQVRQPIASFAPNANAAVTPAASNAFRSSFSLVRILISLLVYSYGALQVPVSLESDGAALTQYND